MRRFRATEGIAFELVEREIVDMAPMRPGVGKRGADR